MIELSTHDERIAKLMRGDYEHEDVLVYNAEETEIYANFDYSKLRTKSYTEVTGKCDGIDFITSIVYPWFWLTSTIRNCWDLSWNEPENNNLSWTEPKRYWQTSKYPTTLFTCMLGQPKPHRKDIFSLLKLNGLPSKYISFFGMGINIDLDPETIHTITHTQRTHRFPPWYDEVLIDLVVETHDDAVFYTEKTWKPFLGMRLPMIFGAPNMNVFLKDNGFRFPENLIDYSYDTIEDSHLRAKTLVSELKRLNEEVDLDTLHDETLEIRKHNQMRALEIPKDIDVPKYPKYEEEHKHSVGISNAIINEDYSYFVEDFS
tara:strand:+ start:82 stop:1032 length:951 start_codon:yes stop_codon:yes gene_type:complete